ncbi:MAG: putative MarR family transcriptional regulator [Ilumatobacteraceae bacterium]|nr:putative MarR family transcriptional regulator [Ilumatobacteraceae bacterium]
MSVRWLNPQEMRAWRAFAEVNNQLMSALEADLAPHHLTFGDYEVLVQLSEATDQQLRMCDLAERLGLSPSGLTRRLDGLVKAGFVERKPSSADRRVMLATLNDAGATAMRAAAEDHVASVRRHLIDRLDETQVEALGDIFGTVAEGLGLSLTIA